MGKKKTYSDLSFKILFGDNNKGIDIKGKRKSLFNTDIKVRNRISLSNKRNNIDLEIENNDKKDEEEKEDEGEEYKSKEKKRNVKKKMKINQTDIKKAKKIMKYRKTVIINEDEKEENDD